LTIDLGRLNSATKYPSIETYHALDPKNGMLLERQMLFDGDLAILTEKVDGTNGRIIVMPDGDFYIGSREELFHAKGDRVWNSQLGIVDALYDLAYGGPKPIPERGVIKTYYLEVYGGSIGQSYKNYTTSKTTVDYRLFDVSFVPVATLEMERDRIASWRDHGGQQWASEDLLQATATGDRIPLVPRLSVIEGHHLPRTIDETHAWLSEYLPKTQVALDDTGRGAGEGIVIRTPDRVTIAKARFQDYERTIRRRVREGLGETGRTR
jgi:hypothetical protein